MKTMKKLFLAGLIFLALTAVAFADGPDPQEAIKKSTLESAHPGDLQW